ncbi:winged helix-turn-helix transcriptional regulator [Alteromonas pelagimontana]|uniref:Winged helix-turn-helix transcriptional regulator n=1 Tax=Alteromonas pelagimontana TaxID=1858656 RepID=A0A6M4MGK1_9ALTE|nr:metalloregulator ArsR/SmtB family transcription factor [Alteromonas pelagimontana]QJR82321.1 winged helix-turn-helix transcriptional regulator [Alteromonas pelagimontana]
MQNTKKTRELLTHAEDVERYLKHLANKTRLRVMGSLLEQELSVTDLLKRIPVTQPVLSQHLALLRDASLVATRRDGQVIYYRIADTRIHRTMSLLTDFFCKSGDG